MNKLRIKHGVSAQLMGAVLISLLAGAALFFVLLLLGTVLLDKTVYSRPFVESMSDRQFILLEAYVEDEEVTRDYLRPLDIWCSRGEKVYLSIYVDDTILYESLLTSKVRPDISSYDPSLEDPEREYELTLSDGTVTRTFLYYYTGDVYYYWVVVTASLAAFALFSLLFITLVHRKLRYIKQLKAELDILAGGDLGYEVTVRGSDELSELAHGIDEMRRSILAHQKAEDEMRAANSELVTAMSHDLRTPLTSLLAYLELIDRGKYADEAQLKHFISRSLDNTLRIKSMADKLFEYFLVYSSEWEHETMEVLEAADLIQQLCGEYAFSLESSGFTVRCDIGPVSGRLYADAALLRRVFDNLYSNLVKYADPAKEIALDCRRQGGSLRLTMHNSVSPSGERGESTNIGLKTCSKIVRRHNGSFNVSCDGNSFEVEILLPLSDG